MNNIIQTLNRVTLLNGLNRPRNLLEFKGRPSLYFSMITLPNR